jgi:CRP/FNR family cyclic AMP-dependent transcriptional regulator
MDDAAAFIRQFPLKRFPKGQILLYQDAAIDHLYAVRSGFIKIHDFSPTGDEQLIWIDKKYDFVPLELLYSNVTVSRFYYSALTDVEAYEVDKERFLQYTQQHLEIMPFIARAISDMQHNAIELINALQKPRAKEKLLYALSFISSRFSGATVGEEHAVVVPLTQQDIANIAGMTRETAATELKKLKDGGYISYDKASMSINVRKLRALL